MQGGVMATVVVGTLLSLAHAPGLLFGGCFIVVTVMAIVIVVAIVVVIALLSLRGLLVVYGGCFVKTHRGITVMAMVTIVALLPLRCVLHLCVGRCFMDAHWGVAVMGVITVLPLAPSLSLLFSLLGPVAAVAAFTIGLVVEVIVAGFIVVTIIVGFIGLVVVTAAGSGIVCGGAIGLGALMAAATAVSIALITASGVLAVGHPVVVGAAPQFVGLCRFSRVWMRWWVHGQLICSECELSFPAIKCHGWLKKGEGVLTSSFLQLQGRLHPCLPSHCRFF